MDDEYAHVQSEQVHVAIEAAAVSADDERGLTSGSSSSPAPAPTTGTRKQSSARRRTSFFPLPRPSSAAATKDAVSTNTATAVHVATTSNHPPLKILVASWNVGNAMPPRHPQTISEWIPEGGGDFDVIAIGLQESSYREKTPSSEVVPVDDSVDETCGSSSATYPPASACSDATDANACGDGTPSRCECDSDNDDLYCDEDEGHDRDNSLDDAELTTVLTDAQRSVQDDDHDASQKSPQSCPHTNGQSELNVNTSANANASAASNGDVIIKRSRTKKSMRKVSKLVRQVSTNLRDSVADVLDYSFHRQLNMHVGDRYVLAGKVELMEMRLFLYVHTRHAVTSVEKLSVPTGLGSVLGNKGGLVLKLVVQDTSLCFVSCHLAAHQDQKFLDKRNSDCASILSASTFGLKKVSLEHQFDHCFWFGDLNYRVDLSYTKPRVVDRTFEQHVAEVLALVRAKQWDVLNANDQLRAQVDARKALAGWTLPPALFPPTFKRIRHAADEYNPQRIPSYCDRVLHTSLPGRRAHLTLERFACIESISSSDHKPVVAEFAVRTTLPVRVLDSLSVQQQQQQQEQQTTLVEITELTATDLLGMDMTGLSDPYIKFYSVPSAALQVESSGSHPSTTTIMNTLSPSWRDDQVPKLRVLCDTATDVSLVHLVLLLMDYDTTSADDVLGVATLSLDRFCRLHTTAPQSVPFDIPITRYGKAAGTVRGQLRVTLPHQAAAAALATRQSTRTLPHNAMATCSCSLS